MTWSAVLPPTRSAAMTRAALVRPAAYARTRNHISGAVTGLSPWLGDAARGVGPSAAERSNGSESQTGL